MLTDRELRAMRDTQFATMSDTVEIQRRTNTDDGFGGRTGTTWATVVSDIPARVTQSQTLDMGGQAGRKIEIEKWTVRLPYGTDCREHDRIIYGSIVISADEVKLGSWKTVLSVAGELVK
jgi:hypothetical protein